MKKFAMLALLLSLSGLTVGCNKDAGKKPADAAPPAADAAPPADAAAPPADAPAGEEKK